MKRLSFALALCALAFTLACQTPPKKEREDAESAFGALAQFKPCQLPKTAEAERMLEMARKAYNDGKHDDARLLFVKAKDLAKQAEEEARNDPDCRKLLGLDPLPAGNDATDISVEGGNPPAVEGGTPTGGGDGQGLTGDGFGGPDGKGLWGPIYFELDSFAIDERGRQIINKLAGYLKKKTVVTVVIEGHCDERGSDDYNLALGQKRSQAVKDLLTRQGIAAARLDAQSFGEERPAVEGSDEEAWSKNRRAELKLVNND